MTRFCKNRLKKSAVLFLMGCMLVLLSYGARAESEEVIQSLGTEVTELSTQRESDALYLSAAVSFELSSAVKDALLKGVPMVFVAQAHIYEHRWYWSDKKIASVTRNLRLAYQPLTRRWQLSAASGPVNLTGLRASLNQNYDSLAEALAAIKHFSHWKIADTADLDEDAKYRLAFYFSLDLSQLPRPFQIGIFGQKEWTIEVEKEQPLQLSAVTEAAE